MNKSRIFKLGLLVSMLVSSVCIHAAQVLSEEKKCVPPFNLHDFYNPYSSWDIYFSWVDTPDYATIDAIDITNANGYLIQTIVPDITFPRAFIESYHQQLPLYFYSVCAGKRSSPTIYFPTVGEYPPTR